LEIMPSKQKQSGSATYTYVCATMIVSST
jgi:hypothetical protein